MAERLRLTPNAEHPITIAPNPHRVVVRVGGTIVADTLNALALREASYPAVQYIPRADVDMAALARSDHVTYCPYKGEAHYFSLPALGARGTDAIWTYETPYPAVAEIACHVAFYPDRVDIREE